MSVLLLAIADMDHVVWADRFRRRAPGRTIRTWPDDVGHPAEIAYVCAWRAPPGLLATFPNLKVIFSLGAGVDHLLADPSLPNVPIVRFVDPDLTMRMREYVVLHVLMHHRRQRIYDAQQRRRLWREHPQPAASEVGVGVMGLGELGRSCAEALSRIGFRVAGWSRTKKEIPGIEAFCGADGLDRFLARTEILVCLLPHTPLTEGILDLGLFRKLRRDGALGGACLINAGRGRLQVDADILSALEEGTLMGATLDVFPTEPLPSSSPLWDRPDVTITPHNAAVSVPTAFVDNVLQQIERFEAGLALAHVVDRAAGY